LTVVAIHQPNYLPWLGYFSKITQADVLVFLDNVQFSKNSYINRTRILVNAAPRWLTVPVSVRLGDPIDAVFPARPDWPSRHLDALAGAYRRAPAFRTCWPSVRGAVESAPAAALAAINRHLIERVAGHLGLTCRFVAASTIDTGGAMGTDRLVRLVQAIDPTGVYLSGRGGAGYQSEQAFAAAGITLRYTEFGHPRYAQGADAFVDGLSVLDCVFACGWDGTAQRLRQSPTAPGR